MMRNICKVLGMVLLLLLPVQAIAFFEVSGNYPVNIIYPRFLTSADFDGDGNIDLAVSNPTGSLNPYISLLFGKGDGTFKPAVNRVTGINLTSGSIASADFNGDGKVDLVTIGDFLPPGSVGPHQGGLLVLLGIGDGTFQVPIVFQTGGVANNLAIGDLNNDGNMDVVVTNQGLPYVDSVGVLLGVGDGTFLPVANYTVGTYPSGVSLIDFSGDGNLDMAVTNRFSQTVTFLLGTGSGGFSSVSPYTTGSLPESTAGGDFNADGLMDMVVTDTNGGRSGFTVFPGAGSGSFAAGIHYPSDGICYDVAIDDFDSDGAMDIILAGTSNFAAIRVILGVGNGAFFSEVGYGDGSKSPIAMVKADFNHDAKPDLALVNIGAGDVTVLLNRYQAPTPPPPALDSSGSSGGGCLMANTAWQMMLPMLMVSLMLFGFRRKWT